mgnify:CR=1 FL=1
MKKIKIIYAKEGMTLARPIYAYGGICLLESGRILTKTNIRQLRRRNVTKIDVLS